MTSVLQAILATRSVLKSQRIAQSERNSRRTRRQLVGAGYESLEPRALMAVITMGEPVYETIGTVGGRDQFEFTLESSTRLAFDTLASVDGARWTLQGPAGTLVDNRPLTSDLSSQLIRSPTSVAHFRVRLTGYFFRLLTKRLMERESLSRSHRQRQLDLPAASPASLLGMRTQAMI